MASYRNWLAVAILGFFTGLSLFLAHPGTPLSHLGLILCVAMPILAFYRLMKPAIGKRHCPVKPDWTAR